MGELPYWGQGFLRKLVAGGGGVYRAEIGAAGGNSTLDISPEIGNPKSEILGEREAPPAAQAAQASGPSCFSQIVAYAGPTPCCLTAETRSIFRVLYGAYHVSVTADITAPHAVRT